MREHVVPLILLLVASGVTSFVTTAIVKRVAEEVGAIDHPGARKLHIGATPRLGGLAIIFGFGFPLMLLAANEKAAELVSKNLTYLFAVLASGSLIVGLGVYDDLLGSNAPKKFMVQAAAASILVAFGFRFSSISVADHVVPLGYVGWLVSIIWMAFAIVAVIRYDVFSLVIMTALGGSLIGFYRWNKPPAKIFMGDTGSLFIGLLLAACSIARPSKAPTALLVGGPMLALALPVLDTLIVMKQRFGEPAERGHQRITRMFNADRRHFHHVVSEKYGSITKAILAIWFVSLLFAVAAVLTVMPELRAAGYGVGIVGVLVMVFFRYWFRRGAPMAATGSQT